MLESSQEVVITLIGGTFLLLFLVVVVIIAVMRYQNRNRQHIMEMQRLKHEAEQEMLKTRLEVQERTLTEVSHEIHDNIGQTLSVVNLTLYGVKSSTPETAEHVKDAIDMVNRAIGDLRNLSKVLNSDFISKQSLSFLLQREVAVINRTGRFNISLETLGDEVDMESSRQLVLFRIAQECIQNAIKHSQAQNIQVRLDYLTPGQCELYIEDNGKGFILEDALKGNGFTNLYTRANIIGAKLQVNSYPDNGTKISLVVPLTFNTLPNTKI